MSPGPLSSLVVAGPQAPAVASLPFEEAGTCASGFRALGPWLPLSTEAFCKGPCGAPCPRGLRGWQAVSKAQECCWGNCPLACCCSCWGEQDGWLMDLGALGAGTWPSHKLWPQPGHARGHGTASVSSVKSGAGSGAFQGLFWVCLNSVLIWGPGCGDSAREGGMSSSTDNGPESGRASRWHLRLQGVGRVSPSKQLPSWALKDE